LFRPPAGTQVHSAEEAHGRTAFDLPIHEAVQRAPFRILLPNRVPDEWRLTVTFVEARLRSRPLVVLDYRSQDATAELMITETTLDAPGILAEGEGVPRLEEIVRDGVRMRVRASAEEWPESQLTLVRDDTAIAMTSRQFGVEALAKLAVSLVPAPDKPPLTQIERSRPQRAPEACDQRSPPSFVYERSNQAVAAQPELDCLVALRHGNAAAVIVRTAARRRTRQVDSWVSANFPMDFPAAVPFGLIEPKIAGKLWSPKPEVGGLSPPCPVRLTAPNPTREAGFASPHASARLRQETAICGAGRTLVRPMSGQTGSAERCESNLPMPYRVVRTRRLSVAEIGPAQSDA
jgi:hypothetical protein